MNHKLDFYFSELLQSLKFVSLFIYFVGNSGRYKNPLYGITKLSGKVHGFISTEVGINYLQFFELTGTDGKMGTMQCIYPLKK